MMLMSVSIGLVWFKMVFVYILRCLCLSVLVWSGLRCFLSIYITMFMSVSIGLVWFKMVFVYIYYDVDVCQYWSGLV